MAADSRGAALGGSNPSGDGGPRLLSPSGKGNKPVALADITNTGRPNASRSISVADVVKEDAKLIHLHNDNIKITGTNIVEMQKLHLALETNIIEMQKLHLALQTSGQENLQLTQANSQMLAELNTAKDSIRTLQRELSFTTALLKVKDSEVERKNKTGNQRRKEVNSQDNAELIQLSNEKIKLHAALQASRRQNLQLTQANSQMLAELNRGKDRIKTLQHELSCTRAVLKVKNSEVKTLQHELSCTRALLEVKDSEVEGNNKTANQRRKEVNSQDVLKARPSKVSAVDTHRIDGSVMSAVVESQSAVPSNPGCQDPPQDAAKKRGSNEQRLALCEEDSDVEDLNAEGDTTTSEALCYEDKRNAEGDTTTSEALCYENKRKSARLNSVPYSQRRKSARLNSVPSEDMNGTFETLQGRKRSLRLWRLKRSSLTRRYP